MSTDTLTAEAVATKALELAEANPDFIYKAVSAASEATGTCFYVHNRRSDAPVGGCLFGQALLALGVDPEVIPEGVEISGVLRGLDVGLGGDNLLTAMDMAQSAQDSGKVVGK